MIRGFGAALIASAGLLAGWPAASMAQAPSAAAQVAQPTPASRAAALVRQSRAAEAKGQDTDALRLASDALDLDPTSRDAADVKVGALLRGGRLAEALDAYDAWQQAARREDEPILGRVSRAVLEELASGSDRPIQAHALEALARLGQAEARTTLTTLRESRDDAGAVAAATEALARLGDARATADLVRAADQGGRAGRISAIGALKRVGGPTVAGPIVAALADRDIEVRATAADALASITGPAVVPALRQALKDPVYLVRLAAAASLKRHGRSEGDPVLAKALSSELADARLMAAAAYVGSRDRGWVRHIRPLLADMNGLNRLVAAELLLPVDRLASLDTLRKAAVDENPWVRAEAARILAAAPGANASDVRPFLRDPSPWARLRAAGRLATRPETPRAPAPAK